VAGFIGSPAMNFIPCRIVNAGSGLGVRLSGDITLALPDIQADRYRGHVDRPMIFGIRPEHMTEQRQHTSAQQIDFSCTVSVLEPMGVDTMVFVEIDGTEVTARAAPRSVSPVGTEMAFTIDMNNMHLIDPETDRVI